MISSTTDKDALHRHFLKDKVLFAYHLGDLDPFFFPKCTWLTRDSESHADGIDEVILVYAALDTPSVLAFGVGSDYADFVREAADNLPDRFFCHYQERSHAALLESFDEKPLGAHLKMHLPSTAKALDWPHAPEDENIRRLKRSPLGPLTALYVEAYPDNYFDPRMLDTGKYFGCLESDRLIAVAGIHVYSKRFDIAVLGNVTTAPNRRGRGLATFVTARLVMDLLDEGIGTICLNVAEGNEPAIRCYERLGFETVHRYREGLFARR